MLRLARTAEARVETQGAARLGRGLGRSDLVARAVSVLNGAGVWSWREHGRRDDEFVALLADAATGSAPRDEARLLAALQMELFYALDAPAAEVAGARSVELARAAGDVDVLQEVLLVRALSLWGPGAAPVRLELCRSCWRSRPSARYARS